MRYAVSLLLIVLAVAFMGCSHRQANLSRKNMESRVSNNTTPPCIEPNIGNVHEEYHVVVFGYNKPKSSQSHTFATWVRTKNKQILDQVDISWMPKTGVKDEVLGTNKCLAESLHDASGANLAYYVLRTDRTFFEAAQNQRDNLYTYKVLENKRKQKIINPVRACSEVAGDIDIGASNGVIASQKVAEFYVMQKRAWTVPANENDDWVIAILLKTWNCTLP